MENNVMVGIDAKLYNNIVSYCETNDFNPVKYIEKALRERLATDKYGDLNEKFRKVEEHPTPDKTHPEPESEVHIVVQESVNNERVEEVGDFAKAMEGLDNEEKPKKKKRTLKTS